ncbi:NYN domain-containing protein [Aliiroseovarius sp. KMU-50]|uniref:NYN domain-containing protein n=1 Tax=Aliiroseovarius salicola TaxID=3009082 RepID=A0ABT4W2I0_9RHOB|nr:NYN domain-containing protein [Aliiroseovarius sp. KMU-50]MDA5094721.1 NYN domain-containing protein [Aliiroseovarius sp. KMU-50]
MPKDEVKLPSARRVALMIDGENISSALAGKIIHEARKIGDLTVRRVYGNAKRIPGWDDAPGIKLVHTGTGKNAADIALALEAFELCLERGLDALVLASSDGDFSHLAAHLRERGIHVVGMGELKAPENFRLSCNEWCRINTTQEEINQRIIGVFQSLPETPLMGQVNGIMRSKLGITVSDLDQKSWRKYFEAHVEKFCIEGTGQQTRIKLKV